MSAQVYANGREVSGKASTHKVLGAMPDVCLSPPSPPAGPVPVPYPNFAQASDATGGSKKVKAGGKEVDLKGKSKYKKCKGDEAATRSFGGGVISHTITGSVKYVAGSFDVKVEGSCVVRHLDLTTGNHTNSTNGSMSPGAATMAPPPPTQDECEELDQSNKDERERLSEATHKRDETKAHKTVRKAATGNTTITHARFSSGGSSASSRGASKAVIHKYDNSYAKGLPPGSTESQACGGHEYEKGFRPYTSHTESRIIEDIFSADPKPTGGTLVLAIDWPGGEAAGKSSSDPCDHCLDLICAASECLDIYICNDRNEPEEPDC